MDKPKLSHRALCEIALKWLKRAPSAGGPGCAVALSECKTNHKGEIPDAIGFRRTGYAPTDGSVVIEVKTSRADFLADAKKAHRLQGGAGSWRYFMAPPGLISLNELPHKWGLLEVNSRGHTKVAAGLALHFNGRHDEYLRQAGLWRFNDIDHAGEQYLLVRALANTGDPQKVLKMIRESNNQVARLSVAISKIAVSMGLPEHTSSYEIERYARTFINRHLSDPQTKALPRVVSDH